jgi:hypothetical protein
VKRRSPILLAAAPLLAASVTVLAPALAPAASAACAPREWTSVAQSGSPTYASLGTAVGKRNASPNPSTLQYAMSQTTKRSTSWTVGAKATVGWGIAKVEASFSYTVTKETTTGVTVTNTMNVPGKYWGYMQPKVEYRYFRIKDQSLRPDCTVRTDKDYGTLKAITAYPFFAECVAKTACTPKP